MNLVYFIVSFILSLILTSLYYLYLRYILDLIIYYRSIPLFFKHIYHNNQDFFFIFDIFNRYNSELILFKINDDAIINIIDNKQLLELGSHFIDNSFNKVFITLINILNICLS